MTVQELLTGKDDQGVNISLWEAFKMLNFIHANNRKVKIIVNQCQVLIQHWTLVSRSADRAGRPRWHLVRHNAASFIAAPSLHMGSGFTAECCWGQSSISAALRPWRCGVLVARCRRWSPRPLWPVLPSNVSGYLFFMLILILLECAGRVLLWVITRDLVLVKVTHT